MSHIEIIKNLWLGNQYSSSIFEGDSILSIGYSVYRKALLFYSRLLPF